MSEVYRSVPLMQNRLYPSFQLHAFMGNKSTKPEDGLRLAALVTMGWLVQRLGDCAPENLTQMPKPAAYLETTNDHFFSFHFSQGFVVDIVFIPDKSWTLQITEPDLGLI